MTRSPAFPALIAWAVATLACTSTATPVSMGSNTVATPGPQSRAQTGGGGKCAPDHLPTDEDATRVY
jgi:hypothetical protein